jgi:diacylglycerol kinase family enzyme
MRVEAHVATAFDDVETPSTSGSALVVGIVGIDGCGKSSAFRGAVEKLAGSVSIIGVGDEVVGGGPGDPVRERTDLPLSRSARMVGTLAKGLRRPGLYKQVKVLEFVERARIREYAATHHPPAVIVTDGDPLVNSAAWAVARFYREYLAEDDERLTDVLHYLAGDRLIRFNRLGYYLRRAWHLVLLNRLHLAHFEFPDVVYLLDIDPAVAMERIKQRGRPLQSHETITFLTQLASAYRRVCTLLEERCGIPVITIHADALSPGQTLRMVLDDLRKRLATDGPESEKSDPASIEIIATTISGSLRDQRKIGLIGPGFRSLTGTSSRVHIVDSHARAQAIAHEVVGRGARTLVSAGGAGTFNAVLEGSHLSGKIPADLRLAFLRKGSADLIGKALHIPDDLGSAAKVIVDGIEANRCTEADILTVATTNPDGSIQEKYMAGFAGLGIFGDVPRFTESRFVKIYKGVLGTLFGDLGPFYVGLVIATIAWSVRRLLGRVPPVALTLDGDELEPEVWGAIILLNGDLGRDFPLGRGLGLSSGTFRVVALRYRGFRTALRQINACRTATVLERPGDFEAVVREVEALTAAPIRPSRPYMVNVDGLRMMTSGTVQVVVSGSIKLVSGPREEPPEPTSGPKG